MASIGRLDKVPHNIYLIENTANGKLYVGLTKKSIEKRFAMHCSVAFSNKEYNEAARNSRVILRALYKYGKEAFKLSLIDTAECFAEACEKEKYWIAKLNCKTPNGYNMTDGGEGTLGFEMSDEQKKAISKANTGEKNYFYGKRGHQAQNYGKPLDDDHIEKLRKANKNNIPVSVNGVQYQSLMVLAEHFNISRTSAKRLVDWESEVKKAQIYRVVFDGVLYYGIKEAARQLGTTKYKLERRILSGEGDYYNEPWTFDEFVEYLRTLQNGMKAVEYKGEVFRSIKKLSEKYGFDKDVVRRLIRDGMVKEVDEKFYREAHNSKPVRFEGIEYVSKTKFMEEFKISGKEFKRLVSEGYVEVLT